MSMIKISSALVVLMSVICFTACSSGKKATGSSTTVTTGKIDSANAPIVRPVTNRPAMQKAPVPVYDK